MSSPKREHQQQQAAEELAGGDPWLQGLGLLGLLPLDVLVDDLLPQLGVAPLVALSSTSRSWRRLANRDSLWQALYMRRWPLISPTRLSALPRNQQVHAC